MKKSKLSFKKFHRFFYGNIEIFKYYNYYIQGLKINANCVLTYKHFDILIKLIKYIGRKQKQKIKFWFYVTPTFFVTYKPKGLRMGRGKGALSHKILYVTAGTIILQVLMINWIWLEKLLKLCVSKLPVKSKAYLYNL